jgi:hypothetical protein
MLCVKALALFGSLDLPDLLGNWCPLHSAVFFPLPRLSELIALPAGDVM